MVVLLVINGAGRSFDVRAGKLGRVSGIRPVCQVLDDGSSIRG